MIVPLLIAILVFLLFLGGGAIAWFMVRQRRAVHSRKPEKQAAAGSSSLSFRWGYVILPLLILLISVILATFFYGILPGQVAYHFRGDGSPDRWQDREMIVLWLLLPQFLLTGVVGVLSWGMTRLVARFWQSGSSGTKPEGVLAVMGNMVALPQVILCFAMLDIFSYNSYRIHLMPLWVFALIIMVLGGIVLGVFFLRTMWRIWSAASKT